MPYEDFTTYTEVEPDDRIQKTATHVDAELHRDEDAYLYKDKGAGHFTDFEHKIDVKLVSSDVAGWGGVWGLSQNTVDDWKGWATGDIAVLFWTGAGPVYNLKLEERGVGADGYICAVNTMYYLTIKKVGTSLTCKIYSDSARTNLLDTLSRTITDNSYRYIYACLTTNSPAAMIANVDVENLDLQEVVEKEVTDSGVGAETVTRPERKMSLSDQATGQETFSRPERKMTLSEVATALESILKERGVAIIDSATTLESILKTRGVAPLLDSGIGAETITRPERTMTITELASGLEAILKVRNLAAILDSALGVEAISRPKRDITLIESAAGLETILKTRNLIVLDSAVGAETVIKAVIGEVLKLVTDSATGSEVIKRLERSMVISEFATGVEQILKTRHLSITDLASGLDQILKTRILPTITDTAVGSESILKERRLLILDAGLGAEQIFRPERYISISDLAQGIEEILKTRNVAAIIDTATGEELVTAIKPGVSPTKLFLIIGNIAIQLTGD